MKLGVVLPHFGPAASAEAISAAAGYAEQAGFDDVSVGDHIAVRSGAAFPPRDFFEAIVTLVWAAAATTTIGVRSSVLVVPHRQPVVLAKQLATLDALSGGRLTVGVAAGWSPDELALARIPARLRGRRTDEVIDVLRAAWSPEQPVAFPHAPEAGLFEMRPVPTHRIPIWVGGVSAAAQQRALERGDGWIGDATTLPVADQKAIAARLHAERGSAFVVSSFVVSPIRGDQIRDTLNACEDAGLDHVEFGIWAVRDNGELAPVRTLSEWQQGVDRLAASRE